MREPISNKRGNVPRDQHPGCSLTTSLYAICTHTLRHRYTTTHVNIHTHFLSHTHGREEPKKHILEFMEIDWYHNLPLLSVFLMTIIMHVKNEVSGYGQSYR